MNYLEARRGEQLFRRYRTLAVDYYAASDDPNEKAELRQRLDELYPAAVALAQQIDAEVRYGFPANSSMGGVAGNSLMITEEQYFVADDSRLSAIDRCIGGYAFRRAAAKRRLLSLWYWPIDLTGLVLRVPFLVLRAAGLPSAYEQTVWAQGFKVLVFLAMTVIATKLGIEAVSPDKLR